jgi:hypothetical protein
MFLNKRLRSVKIRNCVSDIIYISNTKRIHKHVFDYPFNTNTKNITLFVRIKNNIWSNFKRYLHCFE